MAYTILIVDDSKTVRHTIQKSLNMAEVAINELLEAENGAKALEILKTHWVDIVITDINMPIMNGIELIDQMSQEGLLLAIPVVVISTEGSQTRIDALKEKGIQGYIRKPFTPEALKETLDRVLGEKT